jgi:ribosome-associated toxin RatA of RatAB toxin-antitoxin module
MTVKVEFQDDVPATAERMWDVLTDVQHYPEWVQDIS